MPLLSFPLELLEIIGELCGRSEQCALARFNHCLHGIFNPILYRHNIFDVNPIHSCVFWAARHGRLDTLKTAAAHGADLNDNGIKDEDYHPAWVPYPSDPWVFASPLHLAIKYNHRDIITWLLERNVNLNTTCRGLCNCRARPGPSVWYPLHTAMCVGDESTAFVLIDRGAFMSTDKITGLYCAIRLGNLRLVDALTQRPEFDPYWVLVGGTQIYQANLCSDDGVAVQLVHKLVDRGVPVNDMTSLLPSLLLATSQGRFKVALALLDRGAICLIDLHIVLQSNCDSNAPWYVLKGQYNTEEMGREKERRLDRAELMSRIIARDEYLESEDTWLGGYESATPLFSAAAYAFDANCVKLLLDAGARVDGNLRFTDPNGEWGEPGVPQTQIWGVLKITYTHLPNLSIGHLKELKDSIRLLLQHGASIDSLDGAESALEFACSHPEILHSELVECLVENNSASNISLQHLETVMERWGGEDGGDEVVIFLKRMHEAVSKSTIKVETKNRRKEAGDESMEGLE